MKRCPQCCAIYQGAGIFCENDGRRLVETPGIVVGDDELVPDMPVKRSNSASVATGLAGVVIGIVLCGGGYVAYSLLKPEDGASEHNDSSLEARVRDTSQPRPAPARSVEAQPAASESPTPEEPETVASPEPSAPQAETVATARLNGGPVSTGGPASQGSEQVKTIIEMQDGSILEVDAAWKDAQGVWYRRGGLVSFVEGPRVKAITARTEPKTSSAANQ
jgi:hypothetical protein